MSDGFSPDISRAFNAACAPRSSRFSSLMTCRVLIPVRGMIHSSLVSRNSESMSFVTTFFGRALPVPISLIKKYFFGLDFTSCTWEHRLLRCFGNLQKITCIILRNLFGLYLFSHQSCTSSTLLLRKQIYPRKSSLNLRQLIFFMLLGKANIVPLKWVLKRMWRNAPEERRYLVRLLYKWRNS